MLERIITIVRAAALLVLVYAVIYIFGDGTTVPSPEEIRTVVLEATDKAGEILSVVMERAGPFIDELRHWAHL